MKTHSLFLLLFLSVSAFAAGLPKSAFFVANEGQWEGEFAFKYSGGGAVWYITPEGMTIDFKERREPPRRRMDEPWLDLEEQQLPELVRGHVVKIGYVNGNAHPEIVGENKLSHYSNYIFGQDSCQWRTRVGHYQNVIAKQVWPGVDVEYRIASEGIESVYYVAAGVDPAVVQLQYEGLDAPLRLDSEGNLVLKTSLGEFREKAPQAWQVWQGQREDVGIAFQLTSRNECRLSCPGFDRRLPMTIDPLLYGGYLGGADFDDDIWDIYIADDGTIAVGGHTRSNDFPVTPGAYQTQSNAISGTVTRFTPDGDSLLFSTYFGYANATYIFGISSVLDGSVWACGITGNAINIPLSPNAFDSLSSGENEGFLIHLSSDGTNLLYGSFLGGRYSDLNTGVDLQIDSTGLLYIAGTASIGFPVTPNALFPDIDTTAYWSGFGFLCVFNPANSQLLYSSLIPSNNLTMISHCRVISEGRVWLWGSTRGTDFPVTPDALQSESADDSSAIYPSDGIVLLWNINDNLFEYASYFGGSQKDEILDLWTWDANRIVVCGWTESNDFPLTSGVLDTLLLGGSTPTDGFISVIQRPDSLVASTYLGGDNQPDYVLGVTADSRGIVAAGETYSYDFPVTPDAFDGQFNNNGAPGADYGDAFAVRLDTGLTQLEYGTYLGGWHVEYVYSVNFVTPDIVWIGGHTGSADLPTTPNAFQTSYQGWGDGFLLEFEVPAPNSVSPSIQPLPTQPWLTAYPNPFNNSAQIAFMLPTAQKVTLRLYDVLGREVMMLMDKTQPAGKHIMNFDGNSLSSGTYFCRMQAGGFEQTRKIILVR